MYPGAVEECDGIDNNCSGKIDDGIDMVECYVDADRDGYGDAQTVIEACAAPEGHVTQAGDCDDTYSLAHPGAEELCDGEDNDCDDLLPDDEASDSDSDGVIDCADEDFGILPGDVYAPIVSSTGLCLSAQQDGELARLWSCDDESSQLWAIVDDGSIESLSGLYLEGSASGLALLWGCDGDDRQQWIQANGALIHSSGRCLEAGEGEQVELRACSGRAAARAASSGRSGESDAPRSGRPVSKFQALAPAMAATRFAARPVWSRL